ncbi:MAG: AtpZ/AtpI family protein [Blastocatellia bacterium]
MPKQTEQSKLMLAFSVGAVITSNIVGGVIAGYLLDRWLGTDPWLVVAGVILGTIGAFVSLYRIMARLSGQD